MTVSHPLRWIGLAALCAAAVSGCGSSATGAPAAPDDVLQADGAQGGAADGGPGDAGSAPVGTVTCAAMPQLWSGAHEINHDPRARTITFVWGDGTIAAVWDADPGCAAQPGLGDQLRDSREGALAVQRADCARLRILVDTVRGERARGLTTRGSVPVSDQAQAEAVRRSGGTEQDATVAVERGRLGGELDLDQADRVLAECPEASGGRSADVRGD